VISTSYGYNEADLPAAYEVRQCNEYMKLGLAGVTVIYSSGDNGVAGNSAECCTSAKCAGGTLNSGGSGTFNPSFPGTCPYITAVGATQIKPNTAVTATNPEEACETVIYSGGGFSNVFAMPSYQSSAISTYFTSHKPSYTATQYNNSQTVRGFPDVSANGANYVVAVDGSLSLVYGTSASAPVFGSIITLINEQRIAAGKSAVGFINPTLYANPGAFTDIITGGNQGCGTAGFTAVAGWDPVTGLGTPNYPLLLAAFMALA
jgi:tripeptidyl-peptidase-1